MRFRPVGLALGLLLASAAPAASWVSPAPDVVLYCTPALDSPLHAIAASFRASTGVEVHIFVSPPDGIIGLIKHRARDDVVAADTATIATLAAAKAVRPETIAALGQNPFVLIRNATAPSPAGASLTQLLATHPTVLPDPTTAASFDGASVLREAQAQPASIIGVSDTPTVIAEVRANAALLGLVHQTEASAPGIAKAAALPAAPTAYSAALVTLGQSGNAQGFLAYLTGPQGRQALRKAGLDPKS
jgi:ABC-type molybdate transport system substrate-binding protein